MPDAAALAGSQLDRPARAGVVEADGAHDADCTRYPSIAVSPWAAPTGLDSGEPRWRR